MEDTAIIDLYWKRDERAIEETDRKYGNYCYTVADNILRSREDSEECVSDTWLRAWNSMPPQRPSILRAFLAECADTSGNWDAVEAYEAKELGEAIGRFARELPDKEARLFVRRYFFSEATSDIARRYQMTENNVTVSLSRIRKKLRKYLTEGGFM